MTTLWMLYCLGVSTLLAVAAAAGECVLRGRGVPLRGIWACAVAGSLLLPLWGAATMLVSAQNVPAATAVTQTAEEAFSALDHRAPFAGTSLITIPEQKSWIDRTLELVRPLLNAVSPVVLVAWLATSLWMGVFLLRGWLRIRVQRSRWRRMQLGGREVMISDRIGPAVVGFAHPGIVLPGWILHLEEERRRLVLLHEEEHLRAHDERLLLLASIALIAMPCNPALWFQVRRLRLAVEIDCDARVLCVHPDPCEYGDLLLDVGRRVSAGPMQMAALSEPVSFLARRIHAMVAARRQSRPAAMITLVVAMTAVTIAWQTPRPQVPDFGSSWRSMDPPGDQVMTRADSLPLVVWDGERMTQDSLVRRLYGKTVSLRGPGVLEFVVDADGVVRSAGVRSGPTVYRSADTTVILRGFENGYGSVLPSDVASIQVDRTGYGFPEISSVIWVRLKPGAPLSAVGDRASGSRLTRGAGERLVGDSAHVAAGRPLATYTDTQARLIEQLALQMARHQTEAARFQAEMARHSAEAERLRAQLSALDTLHETLDGSRAGGPASKSNARTTGATGSDTPLGYRSGVGGSASRSTLFPREPLAVIARRYYPELVADPPTSPVTLWFLADSADNVLGTRLEHSRLGVVGLPEVLNAFSNLAKNRVLSWTVTSPTPFGIVWVRVRS